MEQLFHNSKEIIDESIKTYKPYAIVMMFSGGNDSLCALRVCELLNVPITHIMHGITGTGLTETTDFARKIASQTKYVYIEPNAENKYEEYILRKGFFGIGEIAHSYAYHILKREHFSKSLSKHIRQNKRGRNILLLNGARHQESQRRKRTKKHPIRKDGSNIWVNVIHNWTALERNIFLESYETNPVYDIIHKSGECLCGTMQHPFEETRKEITYWFPYWGEKIEKLEKAACEKGFCWKWGEDIPRWVKVAKKLQKIGMDDFTPMCSSCVLRNPIKKESMF